MAEPMTAQQVRALIDGGENLTVEFKGESHRPLSDHELLEAVVCLANRPEGETGWVLVGVEDDGRVSGVQPRSGQAIDPLHVVSLIASRTRPSLACRAEVFEVEGKPVLVIQVPRPSAPVGTADGLYKRRTIGDRGRPQCLPYHFHEMQADRASRGIADYSALEVA
jgi:ATP-dependent DNA helicase RecG